MTIGELARRSGCNIETIRYYERIGLLPVPMRQGQYRQYAAGDVERLAFVRRARQLGFGIDAIRVLLGLSAGGQRACAEAREIAAGHLAEVRRKIADLREMELVLADAVRSCDGGEAPCCPVISALASPVTGGEDCPPLPG